MSVRLLAFIAGAGEFKEVECESLQDYYDVLEAETFDIGHYTIGHREFDVFCDDIATFRDDPIVSGLDSALQPMLFGNLIFANNDGYGETTSLSDDDIEYIKNFVWPVIELSSGKIRKVLTFAN